MKFFETADLRPSSFREWWLRVKILRLMEKAEKAESEEERQRLLEERMKLACELGGMIETR